MPLCQPKGLEVLSGFKHNDKSDRLPCVEHWTKTEEIVLMKFTSVDGRHSTTAQQQAQQEFCDC